MKRPTIARILTFFILIAFVATLAPIPAAAQTRSYPITRYRLKNGLTVILQPIPDAPVVSVVMLYKVGSRNEKPGITGISYIVEHIIHKNTKQYPKGRMAKLLNRIGADFNSFTSNDVTGFYETLAPEYLDLALHIEADRMKNGLVDANSLKVEKKVAMREASGYRRQPSYVLWDQVRATAIMHHPYRWPVHGYESDIENLKARQVKWYYNTYYTPNNAVLAVVGKFDAKKAKVLIRKFFKNMKNPRIKRSKLPVEEPPSIAEKEVNIPGMNNSSMLQVAYHSPSIKDRDLFAMAVIDAILVGGRTARLKKALVRSGYTYNAKAWLDTNIDQGLYHMRFKLRPKQQHNRVEEVLYKEIDRLKNEPIPEEELKMAKNRLKADFVKAKDSITNQAQYLAWYEGIYSYKYLSQYPRNIDRVTTGDIQRVARKYFDVKNRTVGRLYSKKQPKSYIEEDTKNTNSKNRAPVFSLKAPSPMPVDKLPDDVRIGGAISKDSILLAAKKKYFAPKKKPKKGKSKAKKKPKPKPKPKPYKPPVPQPKPFNLRFSRHTLSNGMVLLIHENHISPSIFIKAYVKAGGMYEPADKAGLSKLTTFMLQKGSEGLTPQQLAKQLDSIGAEMKLNSRLQTVEMEVWTLSEHVDKVAPLMAKVLTGPTFPEEALARLREVMISNLKVINRRPSIITSKNFFAAVFPDNHPFHHFRWGSQETIYNITRDDVQAFYKKHFRPESTIVAISGNVDEQKMVQLFENSFSSWKGEGDMPQIIMPPVNLPTTTDKQVNTMMDRNRVEIIMGHKCIPRNHPDFYKFNLMNYILGGGSLITRLGKALENKNLAYSIHSRLDTSIGEGPWAVKMTVDRHKVDRAMRAVIQQLRYMRRKPPAPKEFKDARTSLLGSLPVHLSTNRNVAAMLLTIEYYRLGKDYIRNYHKYYNKIKRNDVLDAAKKYIHPNKMNVIITGPYK